MVLGYGYDGTIWGGEVFLPTLERVGGSHPGADAGGDLATRHPVRMVAGILYSICDERELAATLTSLGLSELESSILLQQIERKVNVPMTSSTGRVLDAVSAALGLCQKRTYDGEPAMTLEGVARYGYPDVALPLEISTYQDRPILDTRRCSPKSSTRKNKEKAQEHCRLGAGHDRARDCNDSRRRSRSHRNE